MRDRKPPPLKRRSLAVGKKKKQNGGEITEPLQHLHVLVLFILSVVVTLETMIHNPLLRWRRDGGKEKEGLIPVKPSCVHVFLFFFSVLVGLGKNKHTLIILCIDGSKLSERYGK